MTRQKHLKQLVRERMQKTGERYASARRHVVAAHQPALDPAAKSHLPGSVPLATALRVLLTHAGITASGGAPLSEALTFGLAGGIGAGVFAFHYEKEDFSSFYVAGTHLWQDPVACVTAACKRLGLAPEIREFGGAGPAEKGLAAWAAEGPVLAWVDMGHLPHRGMPPSMSGGGYHQVVVYRAEPGGEALIGDLADAPIPLPTKVLTEARGRIKKDKFRILRLPQPTRAPDLGKALAAGLQAGAEALTRGRIKNFTIAAFGTWADQLHGAKAKDSWDTVFPAGKHLWTGLTSIHEFVEYYGTGGGLARPLFAEALGEAAALLRKPALAKLGADYARLGESWTELAEAALPEGVALFDEARKLHARRAELVLSGPEGAEDAAAVWRRLAELARQATGRFPLPPSDAIALRQELQHRVRSIHAEEARLAALLQAACQ